MAAHLATDPQLLHISSIIRSLLFRSRLVTLWTENLVQSKQPLNPSNHSDPSTSPIKCMWVVG